MTSIIKKRLKSFKYAFKGILCLFKTQSNAKIHSFATLLVIVSGLFLSLSSVEWCLIVFAIAIVFSAEAFNTSLEFLTDLVSPKYHPLAEKTKDVAAAGVLITSIAAAVIGILVFGPKLLPLIQ
ncbi:MAG: diacylglycerol kinase family protein [Bacteroidetes bacterium]|nr:diacylglycerol kinase family protein [Bacteroidota bacterium]